MLLKLTLVQNRSNPARYGRLVRYVREGDRVVPYGVRYSAAGKVTKVTRLDWRDIGGCEAEPEFAAEWLAHVAGQAFQSERRAA